MIQNKEGMRVVLTNASVKPCNKCFELVAWQKSKTGKFYMVNASVEGNEAVCYRADFHSKTCSPKEVEEFSLEMPGIGDLPTPEIEFVEKYAFAPVEEVVVEKKDDSLSLITAEMAALEEKLNTFKDTFITPIEQLIRDSEQSESDLMEAVQIAIMQMRAEKSAALAEKGKFEKELVLLQNRLRALGVERNAHLAALAAQEKLTALAQSLQEAWIAMPWNDSMMDFQKEDILFALNVFNEGKNGVLNANDRGMGKTFETGAIIDLVTVLFRIKFDREPQVLWLTKKGLVGQTFRELKRWNPDRQMIVLGAKEVVSGKHFDSIKMGADRKTRDFQLDVAIMTNSLVIANYDSLNTTPRLIDHAWDIFVVDEVHKLKGGANCTNWTCSHTVENVSCKATGLWRKTKEIIDRHHPFFLPLSGTPIQNHPKDMWSYLHLFDAEKFPSSKRFEREYAYGYGVEGFKVDWERLIMVMKDQVIRRRKDEVGMNLPDKVEEFIFNELVGKQGDIYTQMHKNMIVKLEGMGDVPLSASYLLPQWNYLQQIAIDPAGVSWKDPDTGEVFNLPETNSMKLEEAFELIETLTSEGEQVVIFSTFNNPLHKLVKMVNDAGLEFNSTGTKVVAKAFTGQQNQDGTGDMIQMEFQQGEIQVLCCNIEAGGEGLNLQKNPEQWAGGACHSIFLNRWWNPAKNAQAEDRLHRKGQTDSVFIHVIQAENSIDQLIAEKLRVKQEMQDGIMESSEIRPAVEWAQIMKGLL